MHIIYLGHSGFLVEFNDCYCIFDYYVGTLPSLMPDKPIFVFASHAHADHYNPNIFDLLHAQDMRHIIAVLSKDIPERRWPGFLAGQAQNLRERNTAELHAVQEDTPSTASIPVYKVTFHQTYSLPCGLTVQTLHSTDRGVAYLVKHDNSVIYHAGDLNDWSFDETSPQYDEQRNRQMCGSYRHEILLLKEWLKETVPDAVFLPLDPRLGSRYAKGFVYFLKKINVKKAYPMHFWDKPEIIQQFLKEYPEYQDVVVNPLHARASST